MPTYRNTGPRRWIRKAGVHVDHGEVFESPVELIDGVEQVKEKKAAGTTGKED